MSDEKRKQALMNELARRIESGEMEYDWDTSDSMAPVDDGPSFFKSPIQAIQKSMAGDYVHRPPKRREGESEVQYRLRDDMAWRAMKRKAAKEGRRATRVGSEGILEKAGEVISDPDLQGVSELGTQVAAEAADWGSTVTGALDDAMLGAPSAAVDMATGGDAKERMDSAADRSPYLDAASTVGAFVSPATVAGKLGRAGQAAMKSAPKGSVMAQGMAGSLSAGAEAAAVNVGSEMVDEAAGRDRGEAASIPAAMLFGGLAGAAGGVAGKLRNKLPELENVERAGGGTSFTKKVRPPPQVLQLTDEAKAAGVTPRALLAQKEAIRKAAQRADLDDAALAAREADLQRALHREQTLQELRQLRSGDASFVPSQSTRELLEEAQRKGVSPQGLLRLQRQEAALASREGLGTIRRVASDVDAAARTERDASRKLLGDVDMLRHQRDVNPNMVMPVVGRPLVHMLRGIINRSAKTRPDDLGLALRMDPAMRGISGMRPGATAAGALTNEGETSSAASDLMEVPAQYAGQMLIRKLLESE